MLYCAVSCPLKVKSVVVDGLVFCFAFNCFWERCFLLFCKDCPLLETNDFLFSATSALEFINQGVSSIDKLSDFEPRDLASIPT